MTHSSRRALRPLALALALCVPALASAQSDSAMHAGDPRVGLKAGWLDAGTASRNMQLVGHANRSAGFVDTTNIGSFGYVNSDMTFSGKYVFQGSFHGFQVWDVSDPKNPVLRTSFTCPGGQGDLSVRGNLLFMSVEENSGRVDCGTQGVQDTVSAERFRGVRIFDISDLDHPKQVAHVQTCRGSHTHTLVDDPADKSHIYVYVSGTGPVRSPSELAGCSRGGPEDTTSSLFRIEVIHVPLAHPEQAKVVATPRIFAAGGKIAGLWMGGTHGEGTQTTSQTNMCHDITAYSAIGLAAGACSGNGILLDISKPGNPRRVAEVIDPNFAYWHSATFSNDGKKVIYTDEWGGGVAPRCRSTDRPEWGADAIFTLTGRKLEHAGYYKLPAWQTAQENCVAHNGNLVPVPGRDIMVQAWYQGGISVFDFTDAAHPKEIAFFDRGPMDSTKLILSGQWSTYWHNGRIYGSEIGRGLDILELQASDLLSQNEIDAAKLVHFEQFNPQNQQKITWPAAFVVARAYVDQLARDNGLAADRVASVNKALDAAEAASGAKRRSALRTLAAQLDREAPKSSEHEKVHLLAKTVRAIR